MILYMYIAPGQVQPTPGQGQTAPRGKSFDVNRNVLSLHSFVASFKKMSLKSDFIQFFFHDLIHVYSPGTDPRRQNLDTIFPIQTQWECSRAYNSIASGSIWPKFELIRDFMFVLVICKYKKGSDQK